MKTSSHLITLLLFALLLLNACKNSPSNNARLIQETLDQLVIDNEIPGLNFSMIDEHGHIENYSAGYADKVTKQPLSESIQFSLAVLEKLTPWRF